MPISLLAGLEHELSKAGLLDAEIPSQPGSVPHPVVADAQALHERIVTLMGEGLSQAEAAGAWAFPEKQ
ncbi:hypothetical protein D3C77_327510 [compost metagenome]